MALPKIIEVKQYSDSITHVTWIINNICPNSCRYCPPSLHTGNNHNYDWDNARRFLDLLFQRYTDIHFTIAGGEPSMSPFFPELVRIIHSAGHTVSVSSNAYKSSAYWEDIAAYCSWISFSYHAEYSGEQYFNNVKAAAKVTRVGANIMMLGSHWLQCVKVYEELSQYKEFTTKPWRINNWLGKDNNGSDYYTPEQLAWFDNVELPPESSKVFPASNRRLPNLNAKFILDDGTVDIKNQASLYLNRRQTDFNGYECEIGLRSLFISALGDVKRGNCNVGGVIGNINTPELIRWPTESVICPYSICGCVGDVNINKRRIPIIVAEHK